MFYKKYHQQKKKKNAQKKADNSELNTSDKPSEVVRKYIITTRITLFVNQFSNVLNALTTFKLLPITQVWDVFNAITSHLLNFSDLQAEVFIIEKNLWLANTGTDTHICNNKWSFVKYTSCTTSMKGVGGLTKLYKIERVILKILITTQKRVLLTLNNVFYLPYSSLNLFNPNKIIDEGGCICKWTIENEDKSEFCAFNEEGHIIQLKYIGSSSHYAFLFVRKVDLRLWHWWFDHMRKWNLFKIYRMVTDMNFDTEVNYEDNLCEPCELATPSKHHDKTIKNRELVALAQICIDIFQINLVEINDHKYELLITDEGIRAQWGFTFKNKSDVFDIIKDFNQYSKTQWPHMIIQSYRINEEREYHLTELKKLIKELEQRLELFSLYHQWQDEHFERAIQIIVERMRKVMIAMNILSFLWPKIFLATIYLVNRSVTTTVKDKTLFQEFWNQVNSQFKKKQVHKLKVSHLKTLRIKCYVLILSKHSLRDKPVNKLQSRAEVSILVGYEDEHIYRVYVFTWKRDKIAWASNVQFNEYSLITDFDNFNNNDDQKHEILKSKGELTLVKKDNSDSSINSTVKDAFDDVDNNDKRLIKLDPVDTNNELNYKSIIENNFNDNSSLSSSSQSVSKGKEDQENDNEDFKKKVDDRDNDQKGNTITVISPESTILIKMSAPHDSRKQWP